MCVHSVHSLLQQFHQHKPENVYRGIAQTKMQKKNSINIRPLFYSMFWPVTDFFNISANQKVRGKRPQVSQGW